MGRTQRKEAVVFHARVDELNVAQQLRADAQVVQLRAWLSAYNLDLQI